MEKKEKVYIAVISILVLLLIVTNIEYKDNPQNETRTEKHIQNCEIWKICDYRDADYGCTSLVCPQTLD